MEIIPPVVTEGIRGKIRDSTPYTFVLHPPEEASADVNDQVDSLANVRLYEERSIEADSIAEKQNLLNAELSRIDALVASSRRQSFLKSIYCSAVRKPDYEIVLHPGQESRADVDAETNQILKVESGRAASLSNNDHALKSALLSAEIAKIARIVRG